MQAPAMTGVVGLIKWSYYNAAAINGYTVLRTKAADGTIAWSLVAAVVMSDPFKLSQKPLMFVAPLKRGGLRWPVLAFDIDKSNTLTAKLGPIEEF
jgi:hypothetical protein